MVLRLQHGDGAWCICANPATDTYHLINGGANNGTDTGLPVIVYGDTAAEVCDLLFSAYELDDDNQLISYTVRDIVLSVGYGSEAAADAFVAKAQAEVPKLLMRPLKHPDRDQWALPVSNHILQTRGVNGPERANINAQIAAQAAAGNHKTPAQAASDGWGW